MAILIPSTKGEGYRAFVDVTFWQGFTKSTFSLDLAVCPFCIMSNWVDIYACHLLRSAIPFLIVRNDWQVI